MEWSEFFEGVKKLNQSFEQGKEIEYLRTELTEFLYDNYYEKVITKFRKDFLKYEKFFDLTQEFFIIIFNKLHKLRATDKNALEHWMNVIAAHLKLQEIRKKYNIENKTTSNFKDGQEETIIDLETDNFEKILARELMEIAVKVVENGKIKLNPSQKKMVLLWLQGLKAREIYEILQKQSSSLTQLNAKVQLCKGCQKLIGFLKKLMEVEDEDEEIEDEDKE